MAAPPGPRNQVSSAENGTKPANCPAGLLAEQSQMLVACEDDKEFGFGEIPKARK